MPDPPGILIYAELLSNIRQVSVGCSLSSAISPSTEAHVSTDGQQFIVRHAGEECVVQLPGRVEAPPKLPIRNRGSNILSWRLPLVSTERQRMLTPSQLDSHRVPWSASDLPPGGQVKCRNCQAVIISEGTVKVWKDLPSENWAEMMEFWHCHKPDNLDQNGSHDHGGDEEHLAARGYGANSRIAGQEGVGFVDLSSFLLLEKDCSNITVSSNPPCPVKPQWVSSLRCVDTPGI
jgi:ubiquitin-protein ligase E3 D